MTAKQILPISLAANVVVAGVLVYCELSHRWACRPPVLAPPVSAITPSVILPTEPACPSPTPSPAPFCWSQVEASDYPTYIANLRGIGCPEQTVRDIITADVGSLYAQKRMELQARGLSAMELARSMEQLQREQDGVLLRLLGPQNGSETAGSSDTSATAKADAAATPGPTVATGDGVPRPLTVPMVLLTPDSSLNLTAEQKEDWSVLSKDFVDAIGGPNQNRNDPEYIIRWKKAQELLDNRARAIFGDEAYSRYQTWAVQQLEMSAK